MGALQKGFAMSSASPKLSDKPSAFQVLNLPVGAASPLWLAFAGAAGAGVAFWLATRWAKPINLEALADALFKAKPQVELEPEALEPPLALKPIAEAVAEPVIESHVVEGPPISETLAAAEVVEIVEEPVVVVAELVTEAAPEPSLVEPPPAKIEAAPVEALAAKPAATKLAARRPKPEPKAAWAKPPTLVKAAKPAVRAPARRGRRPRP